MATAVAALALEELNSPDHPALFSNFDQAVGIVLTAHAEPPLRFLGSTFPFRRKGVFLTAAHCVSGVLPEDLRVVSPELHRGNVTRVEGVVTHASADVAALLVDVKHYGGLRPFYQLGRPPYGGQEIAAWGYPADASRSGKIVPTPRTFRGFVQRSFEHVSHMGYHYRAGELSFGAPAGLSGGPVFNVPHQHLSGLVAENFESTTELHSLEEVEVDGSVTRESVRKVITYGVFVDLTAVSTWLDSVAGPEF